MFSKRTFISLVLFCTLATAVLYLLERYTLLAPDGHRRHVLPENLDGVDMLHVVRPGLTFELQKENNLWVLRQPASVPADEPYVRRLLDTLETLPVEDQLTLRTLGQRGLTLGRLGFAPPQGTIAIHLRGRIFTLDIGHTAPSGNALYVRRPDLPDRVFVTDAALLAALPASVDDLRRRRLLALPANQIGVLEIRRPASPTFRVIRKDNLWQLIQPVSGRASQNAVNELIAALGRLTADSFIRPLDMAASPSQAALTQYGLDAENAVSILLWEQGKTTPLRLRLGAPVPGAPGFCYALMDDQGTVACVSNTVAPHLALPPSAFRNRRLFRETEDALSGITVRYPNQTLELGCNAEREWQLLAPVRSRANQAGTHTFINTLLNLRADDIAYIEDDDPAPPPSDHQLTLAFRTLPPTTLHFSYESPLYRFYFAGTPAVFYYFNASNLPPALVSLDEAAGLADPAIINESLDAVTRVTFATATATQTLERAAGWRPSAGWLPADPLPLLDNLSHLTAARIAQLAPLTSTQLAAHGLAPPAMEITLDLASSGSLRRVLLVGAPAPGGERYATLLGRDLLYLIKTNALPGVRLP